MITADLPAAYLYNNLNAYLVKPRVQGVKTNPQDSDWAGSQVPLSIALRQIRPIGARHLHKCRAPQRGRHFTVTWTPCTSRRRSISYAPGTLKVLGA
jgi:hypothetical protein